MAYGLDDVWLYCSVKHGDVDNTDNKMMLEQKTQLWTLVIMNHGTTAFELETLESTDNFVKYWVEVVARPKETKQKNADLKTGVTDTEMHIINSVYIDGMFTTWEYGSAHDVDDAADIWNGKTWKKQCLDAMIICSTGINVVMNSGTYWKDWDREILQNKFAGI